VGIPTTFVCMQPTYMLYGMQDAACRPKAKFAKLKVALSSPMTCMTLFGGEGAQCKSYVASSKAALLYRAFE
jgi:hypothetical protein